jgi:hypothetical protein
LSRIIPEIRFCVSHGRNDHFINENRKKNRFMAVPINHADLFMFVQTLVGISQSVSEQRNKPI